MDASGNTTERSIQTLYFNYIIVTKECIEMLDAGHRAQRHTLHDLAAIHPVAGFLAAKGNEVQQS